MAGDGAPLQLEAHQAFLDPGGGLGLQGATADEIGRHLQVHQPAQAGLQGGGAGIHIVAVEVHGGLQAQGVAGAEATGGYTCRQQALPEGQTSLPR